MARKYTPMQQYRFPVLMSGIVVGVFMFYKTFSSINQERINQGSRKFTDAPVTILKEHTEK